MHFQYVSHPYFYLINKALHNQLMIWGMVLLLSLMQMKYFILGFLLAIAGRNIGHFPKKYEAMIQSTGRGRPRKKAPPPPSLAVDTTEDMPQSVTMQSLDILSSINKSPLSLPSMCWSIHCSEVVKICKLQDSNGSMKVIHSLRVLSSGSWTIHSHGIEIDPSCCGIFSEVPSTLTWQ